MPDSLLRVLACGSVDDGKSTLIGRLLFECGTIPDDVHGGAGARQPALRHGGRGGSTTRCWSMGWRPSASRASRSTSPTAIFETPTPALHPGRRAGPRAVHPQHGHRRLHRRSGGAAGRCAQGPAGADPPACRDRLAARASARSCWRSTRWTWSGFDQAVFDEIVDGLRRAAAAELGGLAVTAIPVCARDGDNVTAPSARMPWYSGPTLLAALEGGRAPTRACGRSGRSACRCSWSTAPDHRFRGYAGTVRERQRSGSAHRSTNAGCRHRGERRAHRHDGRRPRRSRRRARR